jgi:DNA-binding MarR family transcriptional regulator
VSRSPSPTDGRRIAFRLTNAGEALLVRAKTAIAEHEAWLKDRFSKAELSALEEMLARIYR